MIGDAFDAFPLVFSCCVLVFPVSHTVPVAFPENVQAIVLNSTLAKVHWNPVPSKLIRGHLKGFKVQ